ncbi:MAG TPA: zinc metalloprotease HtpX [Spirochaetia bacterium]|nr:zinc metalloprotease HtpX [Spirochaetia bacterium]
MAGLAALLAWSLFGGPGLLWGAGAAVLALLVTPRISPPAALRMYGGRRLSAYQAPQILGLVQELSQRAGLENVPRVYYLPTGQVNALSVGTRKDSAIGVTEGLLRSLSVRELAGVLAHEVAHITAGDLRVMGLARAARMATNALSFLGRFLLILNLPLILLGVTGLPWLFVLLLLAAPLVSSLLETALSRSREFAADRRAVSLTGDTAGFASALQRIDQASSLLRRMLGVPTRGSRLLDTHPANSARIQRLLAQEDRRAPRFLAA